MILSLEEAKESLKYYKVTHPSDYEKIGGDNITEENIKTALEITGAISGGLETSEDEIFKRELARLVQKTTKD